MSKSHYDKIAAGYAESTKRPMRQYYYFPTLKKNIGSLKGKDVLDLACGEGVSARLWRDLGVKSVTGLDISAKLLAAARREERELSKKKKIKRAITYARADIFSDELGRYYGKFDVVTIIMAVHHAARLAQLKKLFRDAARCLRPRGKVYILMARPETFRDGYHAYGVSYTLSGKREGSAVLVTVSDLTGKRLWRAVNYYWSSQTYEKLLRVAGFKTRWRPVYIDPAGVKKFGPRFWRYLRRRPYYAFLQGEKGK